jgi:CRISP-associated protein Cas1
MAWRVIAITNPAHLSNKLNQLVIRQDEEVTIPVEDIDTLLIDSYGVLLSAQLLSFLSENNTTVILCNDRHLPVSTILPYSQHSRQAKISSVQLEMRAPFKKQLWRSIIEQKITNQAEVLRYFGHRNDDVIALSHDVKSGDSTNRESLAARLYFSRLLDDATRRKPLWYNAALNYGYALVRSNIARHIAARGLIASQGLFHRSELNSFNLADDLIEPFRPIVDLYIMRDIALTHIGQSDASLSRHDRALIIDLLNYYAIIGKKKYTLKYAAEKSVESFSQAMVQNNPELLELARLSS